MASRRRRSKSSLNSNLADINSKISRISKNPNPRKIANDSITNLAIREATIVGQNLADNSVTKVKLASDAYNNATFTGVTTTDGIINAPQKRASVVSGYSSSSGLFNQASRVVMTATTSGSALPTTRPDGTPLVAGDIWISF